MIPESLDPPRWPQGPPICREANLPAFESRPAMRAFAEALRSVSVASWHCRFCGGWHYWGKPHTARGYQMPAHAEAIRRITEG